MVEQIIYLKHTFLSYASLIMFSELRLLSWSNIELCPLITRYGLAEIAELSRVKNGALPISAQVAAAGIGALP